MPLAGTSWLMYPKLELYSQFLIRSERRKLPIWKWNTDYIVDYIHHSTFYIIFTDYHTRIDEHTLSTVRHRRRLTNITSPSLKQQPSILKSRTHKRSRTAPTPYSNYGQDESYIPQQTSFSGYTQQRENATVGGPEATVNISVPEASQNSSVVQPRSLLHQLNNDSGLSASALESPQLFKINKNESVPFSPSQVCHLYIEYPCFVLSKKEKHTSEECFFLFFYQRQFSPSP